MPVASAAKLITLPLSCCACDTVLDIIVFRPSASFARSLKPFASPSSLNVIDIVLFPAIIA